MTLSDEEFREAHKPIPVAAHFNEAHTPEEKVIYALAQIGEGTAEQVLQFLRAETAQHLDAVEILQRLFLDGRIKGAEKNGEWHYDLSKITVPNDGAIDPDLLAPGLD
jgi:hypothetical protein